jgi:hypothetical protein
MVWIGRLRFFCLAPRNRLLPLTATFRLLSTVNLLDSSFSQEIIQQIVAQTGAPADWRQWPPELKAAVVKAIGESQA